MSNIRTRSLAIYTRVCLRCVIMWIYYKVSQISVSMKVTLFIYLFIYLYNNIYSGVSSSAEAGLNGVLINRE